MDIKELELEIRELEKRVAALEERLVMPPMVHIGDGLPFHPIGYVAGCKNEFVEVDPDEPFVPVAYDADLPK